MTMPVVIPFAIPCRGWSKHCSVIQVGARSLTVLNLWTRFRQQKLIPTKGSPTTSKAGGPGPCFPENLWRLIDSQAELPNI